MVEELLKTSIDDALTPCASWGPPRMVEGNPFRLACAVGPPATRDAIRAAWPGEIPKSVRELWETTGEATLFADVDFGQWGMRTFSPSESVSTSQIQRDGRPNDFDPGDVVVAEFLGDQDLLVVDEHGQVMVALPLDPREDWPRPTNDLGTFFAHYVQANGAKWWETS